MICKNCGKEFDGKFCPECGTRVEEEQNLTQCPNCGSERMDDGKFCNNCGYSLVDQVQQATENKPNSNNGNSKKFLNVFAKIYRWLLAGGMLFLGIVSLLCLTAPVITENFLGESVPLCTGFEALSGKGGAPTSIVNSSIMLLVTSILCMIYGGVQLYFAIKKPYIGIKKYILWGIDGAVALIILILGCVVAGEAGSEELMDGRLGSGFAMCIVMGIFALICLGVRIFYELKVFKWEDTGLTPEQIEKSRERKPIDKAKVKKLALRIGVPVLVVAVLLAVIIPTVAWATNIFRAGKVDKINIGDSQEQVVKILGEPYKKNDYRYEYYSNEYLKLLKKIDKLSDADDWDIDEDTDIDDAFDKIEDNFDKLTKLEEELDKMVYQYICVDFDSDGKVTSVFLDAKKCNSKEVKKTVKSYDVQGVTTLQQYDTLNLSYTVKYNDGSLYKGIAINQVISNLIADKYEWTDKFGNEFSVKLSVKPITRLTSEIVSLIAGGDKSLLTEFEISSNITEIESNAFEGCVNLFKVTLPTWAIRYIPKDNLTTVIINGGDSIGDEAFRDCISLTNVEIPVNVTSIGYEAFIGCSKLNSIVIPISVGNIGYRAFSECSSLTIYCETGKKPHGWNTSWNYSNCSVKWGHNNITTDNNFDYVVHNDNIYLTKYKTNENEVVIPDIIDNKKVISIGTTLSSVACIKSITIPSSITNIDSYAFFNCTNLNNITISDRESISDLHPTISC